MRAALVLLACLAGSSHADDRDVQRALLQRDQQSAEFAAGARRGELETLHQKQQLAMLVQMRFCTNRSRFRRWLR